MMGINKITRHIINFGHVVVICVLTSCLSNSSNKFQKSMGIVSKQFEDSLFNHFPLNINGPFRLKYISPEKCKEKGQCGVFLIANVSDEQLSLKRNELIKSGYLVGEFSDSLNFAVNGASNNALKSFGTIPIPNFSEILNNSELMIQQKEIDITKLEVFLIDARPGIFIKKEVTVMSMPDKNLMVRSGIEPGNIIVAEGAIYLQ